MATDEYEERLVTSWSEINVGMRVVMRPCNMCSAVHRGMVIAFIRDRWGRTNEGLIERVPIGAQIEPAPPHARGSNDAGFAFTPYAVEQKMIYEQVGKTSEERRWERQIKKPKPQRKLEKVAAGKIGTTRRRRTANG